MYWLCTCYATKAALSLCKRLEMYGANISNNNRTFLPSLLFAFTSVLTRSLSCQIETESNPAIRDAASQLLGGAGGATGEEGLAALRLFPRRLMLMLMPI